MKRHAPNAHEDLCAHDIYLRAMEPYWNLQAEADRERLLHQIPNSGPPRRSRFKIFLVALGNRFVSAGNWLRAAGQADSAQESYPYLQNNR